MFAAGLFGFSDLLAVLIDLLESQFSLLKVLSDAAVKGSVTLFEHSRNRALLEDLDGIEQSACASVHAADMGDEDVLQVGGVTACLGVEVRTACSETAVADDLHESLCEFEVINRELVGVPSVLGVTAVGVNRTEHAGIYSASQFVFESVACEGGVVDLNIDFEILVETMRFEETDDGLSVHIVLMFGRLARFGFDEERTFESFGTRVVTRHTEHSSHVLFLAALVGVEQAHVALATTPKDIVLCAQFDTGVHRVLDLDDGTRYYIEIGVRAGAVHITGVAEHVRRGPQQFDAGLVHFLFEVIGDGSEVGFVLFYRFALGDEIHVMETEIRDAEFLHDLESRIGFVFGDLQSVCPFIPRELLRSASELVAAFRTEGVPPSHSETHPLFHCFTGYDALSVIVVKRHRVLGLRAFKLDLTDLREILFHVV